VSDHEQERRAAYANLAACAKRFCAAVQEHSEAELELALAVAKVRKYEEFNPKTRRAKK